MFTRTIRATGEKLTVARPAEIGADSEGGKWVTRCDEHGALAYSATQSAAYYTHGVDFCDGCREGGPAPVAKAAPAKSKTPAKKAAAK